MGFLRTAVTLVAAGIATNMVLKARREGLASRGSAGSGSDGSTGRLSGSSGTGSSGMSSVPGVVGGSDSSRGTGVGADSPNEGERLQRQGLAPVAGGDSDNLYGSDSQEGSTPRTAGLADYSRGA